MIYGGVSDSTGKFTFHSVSPGHYSAFIQSAAAGTGGYSDPVPFDVGDSDVADLLVQLKTGATIRGMVVTEGGEKATAGLSDLMINIHQIDIRMPYANGGPINSDGSFEVEGVRPGKNIIVVSVRTGTYGMYPVLRVEQAGRAIPDQILNVPSEGATEPVTIVLGYASGSISGSVHVVNGQIPAGVRFRAVAKLLGEPTGVRPAISSGEVDVRGNFLLPNLLPGSYEVTLYRFDRGTPPVSQQTVTVNKDAIARIEFSIDAALLQQR
jgi:hypothetical protein